MTATATEVKKTATRGSLGQDVHRMKLWMDTAVPFQSEEERNELLCKLVLAYAKGRYKILGPAQRSIAKRFVGVCAERGFWRDKEAVRPFLSLLFSYDEQ